MQEVLVKASVLEGFERFLNARGVALGPIITSAGLDGIDFSDPDIEVRLDAVNSVLEMSAQEANDPCLGLHWAEEYPAGSSGILGYLLMHAGSIRQALRSITRYLSLFLHPAEVELQETKDQASLRWLPQTDPSSGPSIHYSLFSVAVTVLRLRSIAGPQWNPLLIEFPHRAPPCKADMARVLGPHIEFNQPGYAIIVDGGSLDRRQENSDPRLFDLIKNLGERMLADRPNIDDIVAISRKAIISKLSDGRATLENVAEDIGLSTRVLQTQLADHGTTFEHLLQETRKELAISYLRDSDLPLTDIAFLLGFSEPSAFTRAAQRWFQEPPRAHRQTLRASAGLRSGLSN